MLQDIVNLIKDCIAAMSYAFIFNSFRIWLVGAIVAALLTWFLCTNYARLWNKRYNQKLIHHLLYGFAALVSFVAVIGWFAINNLEEITKHYIAIWSDVLKVNEYWGRETFSKAYYEVKELGTENFYNVPSPENSDSYIPINNNESRIKAAYVYANEAYRNFSGQHPFLATILNAQVGLAEDSIKQDVDAYLAGNRGEPSPPKRKEVDFSELNYSSVSTLFESALNTLTDFSSSTSLSPSNSSEYYPAERAIDLASAYLQTSLAEKAHRTVTIGRIILIVAFILLQAIPFGVIGYVAYQDLDRRP